MLWDLRSEAQTSGGGPFTHSPTLSVTDGSTTCYPYQLHVSTVNSCTNGVATITTGGGGGGSNYWNNNVGLGTFYSVGIGTLFPTLDVLQVNASSGGATINGFSNNNTATGGSITTSGANTLNTFTSSGTFTPAFTGTVHVLVIAGGGSGGGNDGGGGGGAGGYIDNLSYSVMNGTPITVTVGAGGTGTTTVGANGTNSVFGSLTAVGGGAGEQGGGAGTGAGNGGSGGGAGANSGSPSPGGSGTAGQGNSGGTTINPAPYPSGAGGGATAVGAAGSGSTSGTGGAGYTSSISGSSLTYACGGGGGGTVNGASAGAAGCSTAGAGASSGNGNAATANYGGGGGGAYNTVYSGGNGGSGIIIVSYTTATTATPTLTLSGNSSVLSKVQSSSSANTLSLINNSKTAVTIDQNGNVGVGSITPGVQLDVNGTARASYFSGNASNLTNLPITLTVTGASGSSSYTQSTNTLNVPTYTLAGLGGITLSSLNGVSPITYSNSTGNIGINTTGTWNGTSATVKTINGLISQGSNITITGSGTSGSPYSIASSGGGSSNWIYSSSGNIGLSTTANVGIGTTFTSSSGLTVMNGNVGIGTWVPQYPLQVNGAAEIAGDIWEYNVVGSKTLQITTSASGNNDTSFVAQRQYGSAFILQTPSSTTNQEFVVRGQGNGSGDYVGIWTGNPTAALDIAGVFKVSTTGNVGIGTNANQAALSVMNGNVGIGTWVPGAPFVIGNGAFKFDGTNVGIALGQNTNSRGILEMWQQGNTSSSGLAIVNYGQSGSIRYWVDAAGNARIDGGAQQSTQVLMNGDGGTSAGNVGIGTNNANASLELARSKPNNPAFMISSTYSPAHHGDYMTVDSNGNVGIGTWVPSVSLQVNGTIGGSNNGSLQWSISGNGGYGFNSGYTTGNIGVGTSSLQTRLAVMGGNVGIGTVTATGGSLIVASGNVGIGSITPGQALDVVGTIRALTAGACTTLYKCVGGVDVGVIQTSACTLCPASTCVAMNGCF